MFLKIFLTTICAITSLGCPPSADSIPDRHSSADNTVLVRLGFQGGIGGIDERFVIYTNGRVIKTALDKKTSFTLSRSKLMKLKKLLSVLPAAAFRPLPDSGCADCFIFSVTYRGRSTQIDDVALSRASSDNAIAHLSPLEEFTYQLVFD